MPEVAVPNAKSFYSQDALFSLSALGSVEPHFDISRAIRCALQGFDVHSLLDLNDASLMSRIDTKFIVPMHLLVKLLGELTNSFSALCINDKTLFRYESVYFDTEDYLFYRHHHNGKLNRYKVRFRDYLDSNSRYLEVKLKNNKKRTIKERIEVSANSQVDIQLHKDFLSSLHVPNVDDLRPSLINGYQRIALASECRGERLTIDLNLCNQALHHSSTIQQPFDCGQNTLQFNHFAIIELKQARLNRRSPFFSQIRRLGLRPSSFSKYCMGMALTHNSNSNIKSNSFKPIVQRLQRIPQDLQAGSVLCSV